ncbi:lysozyme inhibitor LprI family protein [Paracoccus beibuensis]|uniref:lysozyme inhibitor LprI family protein n=1 Tax=Paracoccus beibuensis TaxID=547602 RepID=UPI00223FC0F9|nr:lysozyme inhibitor LprI family protein [Paracoccus beibuensis]
MRPLLVLALSAAPAFAQGGFDPAPVSDCLAAEGGRDCIGLAARACMEGEGSQTTLGMNQCYADERDLWDGRLNDAFGSAMQTLPPVRAEALREMQRAWIGYRDAACAYDAARYDGGSLAGTVRLQCQMQLTAEQALRLQASLAEDG